MQIRNEEEFVLGTSHMLATPTGREHVKMAQDVSAKIKTKDGECATAGTNEPGQNCSTVCAASSQICRAFA